MMINKRLIMTVPESKPHIVKNVACQWVALLCNIVTMLSIGFMLERLIKKELNTYIMLIVAVVVLLCVIIRFVCTRLANKESYLASKSIKKTLRELIYKKMLQLGSGYTEKVATAEVLQASVDGVEQLQTYFGAYLPQLLYAMLAPLTLFAVLSFVNFKSAIILLICVPLIPVSIIAVQKFAKKLLAKYWGQYTKLGGSFLENLQGLTTLKIYQSDEFKHKEMNKEAEHFRKITMKVLTMQLNSITIMDTIAYGGAALGVILSTCEFAKGNIDFMGCFIIIMLAAEFFLPLRILGSYFHVAMNGMAASDKIFALLDLPVEKEKTLKISNKTEIEIQNLSYSYNSNNKALDNINMHFPKNSFISIVGESGCGKSTLAKILAKINRDYSGSITIGGKELSKINQQSLMENITLISTGSYIFKGTVRDNLLMGKPNATDEEMWQSLEKVNISNFIKNEGGLEMKLSEKGSNLSGGQRQRLALARALLHNSEIYVFDEATSNIDVESENDIMTLLHELTEIKTVILISHRLSNVVSSDYIYVLNKGKLTESGTHDELLINNSVYSKLWNSQKELESFTEVQEYEKAVSI